jgi:hypothetical protein
MIRVIGWVLLYTMLAPGVAIGEQQEPVPAVGARSAGDSSPTESAPTESAPTGAVPTGKDPVGADSDRDPKGAQDDPFDYEASEQISEDLSVSFPVDI